MTTAIAENTAESAVTREYVTFHVNGMLLGIPIGEVEEINRLIDVTYVPHAPPFVRGVVNLRGEVVTVVDLQSLLDLSQAKILPTSRNVIVHWRGTRIGMLVDRVADVVQVSTDEMESPPSNISGVDSQFFGGVYKLKSQLLIVLEVDHLLEQGTVRSEIAHSRS